MGERRRLYFVSMDYGRITALPFVERLSHFPVIDSTNRWAKQFQELPGVGIHVVIADRQTAGQGQRGRSFYSDVGGGLWVSLIVPVSDISSHFSLNRALSLALVETVSSAAPGCACAIKWPNDICCSDRKICGVLMESILKPEGSWIVAGFGLNVNLPTEAFPEELRSTATSLRISSGREHEMESVLLDILQRLELHRRQDAAAEHREYRQRLYRVGATVRIQGHTGVFTDVTQDGRACVSCAPEQRYFTGGPLEFI